MIVRARIEGWRVGILLTEGSRRCRVLCADMPPRVRVVEASRVIRYPEASVAKAKSSIRRLAKMHYGSWAAAPDALKAAYREADK